MKATLPPPQDRPRKQRRGARAVVLCGDDVLLMADRDPFLPGPGWWVTPGGGIEPGEESRSAAARELFEETGYRCDPADLEGPVARRVVVHGYSDRILVQDEEFYLLRVDQPFVVDTGGFTAGERERMGGWAWIGLDDLAGRTVWPANLGDLVRDTDGSCRFLGRVEESTIPVGNAD